jgi:hypothetical protein
MDQRIKQQVQSLMNAVNNAEDAEREAYNLVNDGVSKIINCLRQTNKLTNEVIKEEVQKELPKLVKTTKKKRRLNKAQRKVANKNLKKAWAARRKNAALRRQGKL